LIGIRDAAGRYLLVNTAMAEFVEYDGHGIAQNAAANGGWD
jgi:hypothetical protein